MIFVLETMPLDAITSDNTQGSIGPLSAVYVTVLAWPDRVSWCEASRSIP
jgi:hypothetical protein